MEYVPGGDFRTLLNNAAGSILPMWHVLFYVSEMFVAVNELHKLGYIHRDLKPEVCSYGLNATTSTLNFRCTEFLDGRHRSRQINGLRPCHRCP